MEGKINILNELKEAGAAVLMNIDKSNFFTIPDDYFKNLHSDILSHVFIQSLPSGNPYTIPEEYFNHFPEIVLDKLSVPSFNINKKGSFEVPEGYFDNLAHTILKKIKEPVFESVQEELSQLSPFLSDIPKVNTYSIPQNYFDALNPLASKRNTKQEAKIISIGGKARKWLSYAAAACIAAATFTGGYLYFNSKSARNNISALANVDVQKQLSVLSDDEIDNYLKDNNNIAVYTNIGNDDQQQESIDLQDLLQNVSDEEIHQYLNEDPESRETGGGI
ncbi:MAG: hypothetical protein ABJA35_06775 [Parafilimonas sp.]